ncbi:TPA: galactose mutarotase [Burkholderia vietnamiensis]|uniref:aldose epimerase family protein n=1 Tax=Burkholderia vietnamiensis TaxID=60552 RepID=UPI001594D505|nr:aldose epimerase family protein [Burkholderia vietnamiensis]HDR9012861.1 galactose mutarotase [Burkholderia vietnamiensis]HDR9016886.1 galactose mutarotase [Burkholderia vietnamiensis]HEP6278771.1 galactose mutarotase [Burkholderia vietnamiensis]HEP6283210.1 galactose mutarotase [Burkholderia vietnamiensis]HEP6312028.1 galactose mutarotase [Burkholderia vietnamiensis]
MNPLSTRRPVLAICACATFAFGSNAGSTASAASAAPDVSVSRAHYGTTAAGQPVSQYTLANAHGVTLKIITYGGIVTALDVPDRNGKPADIALGFDSLRDYEAHNGNIHFGALIGRYANRIARGRFVLDGKTWTLPVNDPPNTLHGGPDSFDAKVWTVTGTRSDADGSSVTLRYVSPDGENGFPGTLTTDVTYTLTRDDLIRIDYRATTDRDTVVNLTNHSYFNLAGHDGGSVERQLIEIAASRFTPTDATSIPTGALASVAGTPMDLRQLTPIGAHLRDRDPQLAIAHGYDQNWVLDHGGQSAPAFAARAYDPASGRFLEVYTTQPGLQFYTSNGLNGSVAGKGGTLYRQTDAFALEAEHFPDSPNRPAFPTTVLKPGETLHEVTVWRVGAR